jgi:hypothetical protein
LSVIVQGGLLLSEHRLSVGWFCWFVGKSLGVGETVSLQHSS